MNLWLNTVILSVIFSNVYSFDYVDIASYWVEKYAQTILKRSANNTQCGKDMNLIFSHFKLREPWALQMVDSSGKLEPGLLRGNVRISGDYDGCISINRDENVNNFTGKFCTAKVSPSEDHYGRFRFLENLETIINANYRNKNVSLPRSNLLRDVQMTWSLCLPSTCNATEIQSIWNYTQYYLGLSLHLTFDDRMCDVRETMHYTGLDVFVILFFVLITIIALASTAYDLISIKKYKGKSDTIWATFSLYTNGKKLFSVKESTNNMLHNLNGIRVLSMFWVILGHTFMFRILMPSSNGIDLFEWRTWWPNMIIIGATVSVDTFFVISGLLLVYLFLINKSTNFRKNVISSYIHRILRLTPSLLVCISLYASVLGYFRQTPLFSIILPLQLSCVHNWWKTLLYVQNYVDPVDQCVGHSWYLAVDTQLYFLSPILIFGLIKSPRLAVIGTIMTCLISMAYTFGVTVFFDLGATPFDTSIPYMNLYYQPTHTRMVPWLIGALLGYMLFKLRNVKVRLSNKFVHIMWFLSLSTFVSILYGQICLAKDESVISSAFFNMLARPSWAISISWVIFACIHGYGGYVNKFLSLKIFNVLVRMNYSMYLLHIFVICVLFLQRRTTSHFDNATIYHEYIANAVITLLLSIPWTLLFESPIIAIEKVFRNKRQILTKT